MCVPECAYVVKYTTGKFQLRSMFSGCAHRLKNKANAFLGLETLQRCIIHRPFKSKTSFSVLKLVCAYWY